MWKLTTVCDKGVFSSIIISQLRRPIESSYYHRFVILCISSDAPSEKTGFWQLPKVSIAFKGNSKQQSAELIRFVVNKYV